jgi:hypothetical protein
MLKQFFTASNHFIYENTDLMEVPCLSWQYPLVIDLAYARSASVAVVFSTSSYQLCSPGFETTCEQDICMRLMYRAVQSFGGDKLNIGHVYMLSHGT